jgi:hypothetical protein
MRGYSGDQERKVDVCAAAVVLSRHDVEVREPFNQRVLDA